jgi:uncharacterized protein (DUF1697 family)
MSAKDRFKALEEKNPILSVEANIKKTKSIKRQRVLVTFAIDPDDVDDFNSLQVKLSTRDGVIYKKQDLQIACIKQFIDNAKKDINKIKIEKF